MLPALPLGAAGAAASTTKVDVPSACPLNTAADSESSLPSASWAGPAAVVMDVALVTFG